MNKDTQRFRWVVFAFLAAGGMMTALLAWQLYDTTPARWCAIALQGSPEISTGCFNVLLRLLDIKNNAVLGLLAITGLSVLSLAAVALGVRLGFTAPGGISANVQADTTTVTDGSSTVTIPTPPAEETQ